MLPAAISPLSSMNIGVCCEPPQASITATRTTYDGTHSCDTYMPEDPSGALWLILPGLGATLDDAHLVATARALAYRGAIVVVALMPQGAGDYANAPSAISAAVAFASARPGVDASRRAVLAFSMGGLCGFTSATAGFKLRVGWSALIGLAAGHFDATFAASFYAYLGVADASDPLYASRAAATVYVPSAADPPAAFFVGDGDGIVPPATNSLAAGAALRALGVDAREWTWDGGHGVTLMLTPAAWDTSAHVPRVLVRAAVLGQEADTPILADLVSRV